MQQGKRRENRQADQERQQRGIEVLENESGLQRSTALKIWSECSTQRWRCRCLLWKRGKIAWATSLSIDVMHSKKRRAGEEPERDKGLEDSAKP